MELTAIHCTTPGFTQSTTTYASFASQTQAGQLAYWTQFFYNVAPASSNNLSAFAQFAKCTYAEACAKGNLTEMVS